jgi:hypothetical protein
MQVCRYTSYPYCDIDTGFPAEFAFYVNKTGWRARPRWAIQWEGVPTSFGRRSHVRSSHLSLTGILPQLYIIHTSWPLSQPLWKFAMSRRVTWCRSFPATTSGVCSPTPRPLKFTHLKARSFPTETFQAVLPGSQGHMDLINKATHTVHLVRQGHHLHGFEIR